MFNVWAKELPSTIEVGAIHLPGREGRIREASITSMSDVVAQLVGGLAGVMEEGSYAFYGHSLGALISFELVRELRRRNKPLPACLFASGRRAPQCPALPPSYQLDDKAFLAHISKRYGAMPSAILSDPDVLALFLRIVRADITILDTYHYCDEPPLAVPIMAYGGNRDATLAKTMLEAWRMQTTSTFRLRMFDCGHFFPDDIRPQLLNAIVDDLSAAVSHGALVAGLE